MDPCQVEIARCKGCGLCVEFCPRHLLRLSDELNAAGYHPVLMHDVPKCTACALCAEMCPESAIRVYRRKRRKP